MNEFLVEWWDQQVASRRPKYGYYPSPLMIGVLQVNYANPRFWDWGGTVKSLTDALGLTRR